MAAPASAPAAAAARGQPECSICTKPMQMPLALDCKHQYCFLCLKQAIELHSLSTCPTCRAPLSSHLIRDAEEGKRSIPVPAQDMSRWTYAGKTYGFWNYDFATDNLIEAAYQRLQQYQENPSSISPAPPSIIHVEIGAGQIFQIDLLNLVQKNLNNNRVRAIQRNRDENKNKTKGQAGIIVSRWTPNQINEAMAKATAAAARIPRQDAGSGGPAPG